MTIPTKRLIIRQFVDKDVEWYYDVVQYPEIAKRLKALACADKEVVRKHVEVFAKGNNKDDFYYVITNKKNEVLGFIIAIRITFHTIDVSYFLKEEYRKKGYMHEALQALISAIRKDNPFYMFRMVVDKDNIASLNVMKGFDSRIVEKETRFICYI